MLRSQEEKDAGGLVRVAFESGARGLQGLLISQVLVRLVEQGTAGLEAPQVFREQANKGWPKTFKRTRDVWGHDEVGRVVEEMVRGRWFIDKAVDDCTTNLT